MKDHVETAIRAFRLGEISRGCHSLAMFVEQFNKILSQLSTTESDRDALVTIFTALHAAQSRGDYNYVADVLEQHVKPML